MELHSVMLIDSHSHLHFPVYKEDINAVLGRMKEKNVVTLTVGTSYTNSLEAVEFSKSYGIPCSVGFHPSHAKPSRGISIGDSTPLLRKEGTEKYLDPNEEVYDEEFDVGKLRTLIHQHVIPDSDRESKQKNQKQKDSNSVGVSFGFLDSGSKPGMTNTDDLRESASHLRQSARVLAVGECGLDYFRLPEDENLKKLFKQKQREAFEAQIALAQEFNLPLIVHTRASKEDPNDAYRDTLDIVTRYALPVTRPGVMHCFLADKDWAKKFLDIGFMLSFSGIVTFKKADEIRESARFCPHDMILTETDCPYLAPEPYRGKQNEPAYVEFVLRKLEEVRGERLEERIEENFRKLFGKIDFYGNGDL